MKAVIKTFTKTFLSRRNEYSTGLINHLQVVEQVVFLEKKTNVRIDPVGGSAKSEMSSKNLNIFSVKSSQCDKIELEDGIPPPLTM